MIHTAELVASILARCCETPEHQMKIASSGAIPLLMRLLASGVSKSQEAALGALAALVKDNVDLARIISQMRCKSLFIFKYLTKSSLKLRIFVHLVGFVN